MSSIGIRVISTLFISWVMIGCGEINIVEQQTVDEQLTLDLEIIEEYREAEGITFEEDTTVFPIQYTILEEGTGQSVNYEDIVFCHYNLKLTTGDVFFTSIDTVAINNDIYSENLTYKPIVFTHTQTGWGVTPILNNNTGSSSYESGWRIGVTAALKKMKVGGRALIVSPSSYAYQNEVIIYEVFLINAK